MTGVSPESTTGSQSALGLVDDLSRATFDLKHLLRQLGDANTVSRDAATVRSYLDQIVADAGAVAQALGIEWSPSPG